MPDEQAQSSTQLRGTVENKNPKPAGLLPKNTQQLVILGVAIVMVLIMWLHGSGSWRVRAGFPWPLRSASEPHDEDHDNRNTKNHKLLGVLRKQASWLRRFVLNGAAQLRTATCIRRTFVSLGHGCFRILSSEAHGYFSWRSKFSFLVPRAR